MPNGIDKNWYRMCGAIDGFRGRYERWPTRIRLNEGAIENLFTEESFAKLEEKLTFVYDGSPFVAEDDSGRSYNYGQEGFVDGKSDILAQAWLSVKPDSEIVQAYYAPHSRNKVASEQADRKRNGCLVVLVSELILLLLTFVVLLFSAIASYEGSCIRWEPPIPACSMSEYLRQVVILMPFGFIVLIIRYWWIAVALVILFPLFGRAVLKARRSKETANA